MIDFTKTGHDGLSVSQTHEGPTGLLRKAWAALPLYGTSYIVLSVTLSLTLSYFYGSGFDANEAPLWGNVLALISLCAVVFGSAVKENYPRAMSGFAVLFTPNLTSFMLSTLSAGEDSVPVWWLRKYVALMPWISTFLLVVMALTAMLLLDAEAAVPAEPDLPDQTDRVVRE